MMPGRFIVEHRDGNRWLTHNGFTHKSDREEVLARCREDAMVFDSEAGALAWLKTIHMENDKHNVLKAPPREFNLREGKALTEYSPWG